MIDDPLITFGIEYSIYSNHTINRKKLIGND